jgi:hypothetical protein
VIAYGLLIDRGDEMSTLELTYKVLAKQLRISDRKVLDAAYDGENQRHGTEVGIQDGSLSRDPR